METLGLPAQMARKVTLVPLAPRVLRGTLALLAHSARQAALEQPAHRERLEVQDQLVLAVQPEVPVQPV